MKFHDMQKPLVQSALVLLAILVIIGFVAGSGAESFLGGIFSIVKGAVYTVLFAVALILALIFSVVLLIAIFLGAVSLYSSEKAKEMFVNVRQRTMDIYFSFSNRAGKPRDDRQSESVSPGQHINTQSSPPKDQEKQFASVTSLSAMEQNLSLKIAEIKKNIDELGYKNDHLGTSLDNLEEMVSSLPRADIIERIEQIEAKQDKIETELQESLQKLEKMNISTQSGEENYTKNKDEITAVKTELQSLIKNVESLQTSFAELDNTSTKESSISSGEGEHRIFAYLEKEADRKQFVRCVAEAVKKNMTYAEIDTFLSKSLSKNVDTIIKDHPSLTKEYIRDYKNT